MTFKQNLKNVLFQVVEALNNDNLMKEDVTLRKIHDCIENLIKKEGFSHFAHYELCDCQRQNLCELEKRKNDC